MINIINNYKFNNESFNWINISEEYNSKSNYIRTGKQCRERFINNLSDNIKKDKFNKLEQIKLLNLFKKYQNNWKVILKYFPNRTDSFIKNKVFLLLRKILRLFNNMNKFNRNCLLISECNNK